LGPRDSHVVGLQSRYDASLTLRQSIEARQCE
jgi:hypothetical protein